MIKTVLKHPFSRLSILVLAVSTGLFSACKPQSDFKLDRVDYAAAEQLEVTNPETAECLIDRLVN